MMALLLPLLKMCIGPLMGLIGSAIGAFVLYSKGKSDEKKAASTSELTRAVEAANTRTSIEASVVASPPPSTPDTGIPNATQAEKSTSGASTTVAGNSPGGGIARSNYDGADRLRDDWQVG